MKNENRRIWSADDKRFARMAEKKLQILQAAQRVFLRNGYERASMDAIALEAGVGKMTVYRQYTDKHTLFIACMNDQCREMLVPDRYESAASLDEAESMLIDYGHIVVDLITRRDIVMLFRMMIGEINRFNGLGDVFYRGGPGQAISVIERILGKLFSPEEARLRAGAFFWAALGDAYERVILDVVSADEVQGSFSDQIELAAKIALR
jgi:TetR/AcrR family transcriptional repressor of mexJK operon